MANLLKADRFYLVAACTFGQNVTLVAIGAFDPARVRRDLQPNPRMPAGTTITGHAGFAHSFCFRRFKGHFVLRQVWPGTLIDPVLDGMIAKGNCGAQGQNTFESPPMTEYAIEIAGLRKTYAPTRKTAGKEALKGVDLKIPKGSIFGLLGPNGAGKSTLINIMAGLVLKTSGTVSIWGFDQDQNPRQSRAAIGVVPQELNLDAFLTPREALDLQAGLYGVPKAARRTAEILEAVGLADKAEAYARSLSGGMRRRLLLAKAMVHAPAVLVLDEPTAGVDIELRRMLWDYVRDLNAKGATIILTTHYLEEAEEMCDEIAIINEGQIVVQDRTENLLKSMDTRTLVLTLTKPIEELKDLPAGVTISAREGANLVLTYRRNQTEISAILAAVQASGAGIRDIRTQDPDLEDVFVALTSTKSA